MAHNKIRDVRLRVGLSQQALAERSQIPLRELQRIEADAQPVRYDLAVRICAALEQPMAVIFPATKRALQRASTQGQPNPYSDQRLADDLTKAGFDMSAGRWTFRFRLRGGWSQDLPVAGPEKDRLWSLVQSDDKGFMVFDAGHRRYAINRAHLILSHFLVDPAFVELRQNPEDDQSGLIVCLAEPCEPLTFSVNADTADMACGDGDDGPDDRAIQIQALFVSADLGGPEPFYFRDEDGEDVFLRRADVAMLSVALDDVVPSLFQLEDDD